MTVCVGWPALCHHGVMQPSKPAPWRSMSEGCTNICNVKAACLICLSYIHCAFLLYAFSPSVHATPAHSGASGSFAKRLASLSYLAGWPAEEKIFTNGGEMAGALGNLSKKLTSAGSGSV